MNEDLLNDEYSKKILELENILKEELANESDDDNKGNEDFNNKLNIIKSEQQKEIELLEKQISELEKNNQNNTNIIDISNNDININNDYINNLQKSITDNIVLEKFFKSIEEKTNIMKDKINNEASNLINTYFSKILNDIKNNNNNMISEWLNKQKEINENINTIKEILKIKEEKINNNDKELENNMNKNNSKEMNNNNNNDNINNNNNTLKETDLNNNTNKDNSDNKNKTQKKDETYYNKFLNANTDPYIYSNKVESNLPENNNRANVLNNEKYNSNKEEVKNNDIQNNGYENDNNNEGSKDNYNKNIFIKKNNETNLNNLKGSNKNIVTKNQEENIQEDSDDGKINNSISFYKLNKSCVFHNNFKKKNIIIKYIKNPHPLTKKAFNDMNNFMKEESDKNKNEDRDKTRDGDIYEYGLDAKNREKEKEKEIKKEPRKTYSILKKIFFGDYYQKFVSQKKIDDYQKEIITKELEKEMSEKDENLKNYCLNYIDARVLPLFERKDLNYDQRQVLRYNIETILECCGESKKLFRKYYYPEVLSKKKELNRQKSMEVLKNFRKEYGLKEEDYCNEGLIHRLVENDYNMQRTFQKMFQ